MTTCCLGLDIGGTKIAVGLVEFSGDQTASCGAFQVTERRQISTADAGDGRRLLERVAALGEEVCAARRIDPGALAGVGVALPGPVDPTTQRLFAATGLAGLIDHPITEFFAQRWNQPAPGWVRADNDANAAALAEATYGAGRGSRVVCYFTVSTGIGGGIVVDGQLFRGASGQAGEFGHLKLSHDGPPCFCGDRGCLEALASGPSIARRARAAAASGGGALRALFDQDPALVTAERLAEAVRMGDPVARQVWEAAMVDLGAGVATVMNLFNPDAAVIGGGVSRSADLLLPIVRREVAVRAMPMVARATRVECAVLGDDVGIVGAALLSLGTRA